MARGHRGAGEPVDVVASLRQAARHVQKKTLIAREQDTAERAAFRAEIAQLDPTTLVFVDETSASLRLTPLRGWAPRGQRLVDRVPQRRWEHVTYLASFTLQGIGPSVLVPGAVDRLVFHAFIDQHLVPRLVPGQTVIWDNLAVHKSAYAREAIETAKCRLLFLPRYSPDDHPIEQAFSKLKTHLRRCRARTFETLLAATAEAIDRITPHDAHGFFTAAGLHPSGHNL